MPPDKTLPSLQRAFAMLLHRKVRRGAHWFLSRDTAEMVHSMNPRGVRLGAYYWCVRRTRLVYSVCATVLVTPRRPLTRSSYPADATPPPLTVVLWTLRLRRLWRGGDCPRKV